MIYKILLPLVLILDHLVKHPVEAITYLLFVVVLVLVAGSCLKR